MYEELREQAEDTYLEDDEEFEEQGGGITAVTSRVQSIAFSMTPTQRLIILALLLVVICLFSALCLLVTGRIAPPLP